MPDLKRTPAYEELKKKILQTRPKLYQAKTFSVPKVKHTSGEKLYSSELYGARK